MEPTRKPCYQEADLKLLWKLLRDNASLRPIRTLLKERNLPYSAPGKALFQNQILPALTQQPPHIAESVETDTAPSLEEPDTEAPALTEMDLVQVLRDHEEYGGQHIFLYDCGEARARQLLSEQRVRQELEARNLVGLLDCPRVLDKPHRPCLTDVRFENTNVPKSLVLKAVEKRIYLVREQSDDFTVTIREEEERAVNVMRLHSNGLLELRIAAFRSGGSYNTAQAALWALAKNLLPFEDFEPVDLIPVRKALWDQRSKLIGRLRFRLLRLHTNKGSVVTVVTGEPDDNLTTDRSAVAAVSKVLERAERSTKSTPTGWLKMHRCQTVTSI